jgi:hypothetical protein
VLDAIAVGILLVAFVYMNLFRDAFKNLQLVSVFNCPTISIELTVQTLKLYFYLLDWNCAIDLLGIHVLARNAAQLPCGDGAP